MVIVFEKEDGNKALVLLLLSILFDHIISFDIRGKIRRGGINIAQGGCVECCFRGWCQTK